MFDISNLKVLKYFSAVAALIEKWLESLTRAIPYAFKKNFIVNYELDSYLK